MKTETLKSLGYLISTISVLLLGWTAWPGAEKAGLVGVLAAGMAASVLGMGCRWYSYVLERKAKAAEEAGRRAPRPVSV
jgi:hypothetical protein